MRLLKMVSTALSLDRRSYSEMKIPKTPVLNEVSGKGGFNQLNIFTSSKRAKLDVENRDRTLDDSNNLMSHTINQFVF